MESRLRSERWRKLSRVLEPGDITGRVHAWVSCSKQRELGVTLPRPWTPPVGRAAHQVPL